MDSSDTDTETYSSTKTRFVIDIEVILRLDHVILPNKINLGLVCARFAIMDWRNIVVPSAR